jgi:hypothetical protein
MVWGSSSERLKNEISIEGSCSICKHNQLVFHGIQEYVHIWWIPLLPAGKIFFLTCLNCESTVSNTRVEKLVSFVKRPVFKTPLWSFSFVLILFFFVIFLVMYRYFG